MVYIIVCAHVQVALCMHIYTHTHDISQCKRTTLKTHTCCPPPNMLPPYRAPSLSLIPSLCLLSLSEAREEGGREAGTERDRERDRERDSERVCIRKAMKLVPKMRTLDMYIDMCRC